MNFVIEKLVKTRPVNIVPIARSPWAVVEMDSQRKAEALINQKVVYDPVKFCLIVFRKPAFEVTVNRAFQITNVKYKEDLLDLEKSMVDDGHTMVSQIPPTAEWTSTSTQKIIWRVIAPTNEWKIPTRAVCPTKRTLLAIKLAPVCGICHDDDHPTVSCTWKILYEELGTRRRRH